MATAHIPGKPCKKIVCYYCDAEVVCEIDYASDPITSGKKFEKIVTCSKCGAKHHFEYYMHIEHTGSKGR